LSCDPFFYRLLYRLAAPDCDQTREALWNFGTVRHSVPDSLELSDRAPDQVR